MPVLSTLFGRIVAHENPQYAEDGTLCSCIAADACPLETSYGTLVPQYTSNLLRKRQLPGISFYPNGMLKNLPLEEQIMVSTPLGSLPAEQLTFHENGVLKRIFPLNGTLSGYWTQEDEAKLAVPMALETSVGIVEARIISIYFSPGGALRSLTLWPGDIVEIPTPIGMVRTRVGIAFYDTGVLKSLEPADPVRVPTAVGTLLAYDPDAIGLSGDLNSLQFNENGAIRGLATLSHHFDIHLENGRVQRVSPPMRRNACDDERMEPGPLYVEFDEDRLAFRSEKLSRTVAMAGAVRVAPVTFALPSLSSLCRVNTSFM